MGKIDWLAVLGWKEEQLEDIRLAAYSYIRQGKYDIALPLFEALCAFDPESAYDLQTVGALYVQMGEAEKAIKALDKALKIEGDHSATLINLTKALLMLGRKREALKLCEILKKETDPFISNMAKALLLAYS